MSLPPRRRPWVLLALPVAAAFAAAPASAGSFYVSGGVGISSLAGDSGGTNAFLGFQNRGDDSDSSPVFGGAVGFTFDMTEVYAGDVRPLSWAAWDWTRGARDWEFRLPSWDIRVELEARGGRDVELETDGFVADTPYRSDVNAWSVLNNVYVDLPIHRLLSLAFGRVPILEPLSLYTSAGLGLAINDVQTSDTIVRGSKQSLNFAYQLGTGFNYALTDSITLGLGYRYMDLGEVDVGLKDDLGDQGNFTLDLGAHELTSTVRFDFYSMRLRD